MLGRMRYLGIDYGTKRVGLALSDVGGTMAFPHAVIENSPKLMAALATLIKEKEVEAIVIGHSLDREGNANAVHEAVTALMTDLTLETGLPIDLEPEQYTTQAALRLQGRNDKTDASAAALILDSYLQKQAR